MTSRNRDVAIVGMACRFADADLFESFKRLLEGQLWHEPHATFDFREEIISDLIRDAIEDAGLPRTFPKDRRMEVVVACDGPATPTDFRPRTLRTEIQADGGAAFPAIDLGIRQLRHRMADLVIVAGAGASEVGVVVLKRLRDAIKHSNRVYAVIKAMAVTRTKDSTPVERAIAVTARRAYRRGKVDPATIGLGNGVELRGSNDDLRPQQDRAMDIPSGQASGAGIAGFIHAALCLHHRVLPPSNANPSRKPWIHGDTTTERRATVNGFGRSGICGHAILESHPGLDPAASPGCLVTWESEAFLIEADDRAHLIQKSQSLLSWIDRNPNVSPKDLAYTLNTSTSAAPPARLGIVAGTLTDLASRLSAAIARLEDRSCRSIRDSRGIYYWEAPLAAGGVAMLFPGEGSQYPGMLGDLCLHFPEVLSRFDVAERISRDYGSRQRPSRMIFGGPDESDASPWSMGPAINAVLSSQWAIFQLLGNLGIRPDAVAGHSSGEFLALAAAGSVPVDRRFEDGLAGLGALFEQLEAGGKVPPARLAAIGTGREQVHAACGEHPDVRIAIDNCPHQVVIAGPSESVDRLLAGFRSKGIVAELLPFERAYHTPEFSAVVRPIREFFERLQLASPVLPIYSCASARRMPEDARGVLELAVEQWTRPVRFRETVEAMHADGYRIFLDVGARGNLAGFVEDTLRGRPSFVVAANLPRRPGLTQLNHLVAGLFAQGVSLRTDHLYARRRPQRLDLTSPSRRPHPKLARVTNQGQQWLDTRSDKNYELILTPNEATPVDGVHAMSRNLFHATMDFFARTQDEVYAAFLKHPSRRESERTGLSLADIEVTPGPWAGRVIEIDPGRRVVTRHRLVREDDPVAKHHTLGGRRVSAIEPSRLGLPVLPFAVMAEMLAQVAALLNPGKQLVALEDVRAHRWIRYEDSAVILEIEAVADPENPGAVRVAISNRGSADGSKPGEQPVVEGIAIFARERPPSPHATAFSLADAGPSIFTAERLYDEQWLFHGPAFQAVVEVGPISDSGIEGKLRVLPAGPLLKQPSRAGELLTDPIIIDAFTHLLGCWGLDRLKEGDVIFPLRMGRLRICGDAPPVYSEVSCRIRVVHRDYYRVRVEAELVRTDGTLWMKISDWEDWRFHWPGCYRDVFRRPDVEFVGERLEIPHEAGEDTLAVWIQPPVDMGKPVWRDVLEQTQLSPFEGGRLTRDPEPRRSQRLWGRMAAKEAARRLWRDRGRGAVFPADLEVRPDPSGRPRLHHLDPEFDDELPTLSIAHTEGVAVAIATTNPGQKVGIDVERIIPRSPDFESLAFLPQERGWIDRLQELGREEVIARLWCIKEAASKATGLGLVAGPASVEVVTLRRDGTAIAALGPALRVAMPELPHHRMQVTTCKKGNYVWAYTTGREAESDG